MTELPPQLPETGKFKALYGWMNKLRAAVYSLRPLQSDGVVTEATTVGVYRQGFGGKKGEDGQIPLAEQWDPETSYVERDLVFCQTDAEFDSGRHAGLYQCLVDIAGDAGNDEPAEDPTNWRCIVNLHFEKFTMRHSDGNQKIILDAGRDSGDKPSLIIYTNSAAESDGSIKLMISDIPSGAGNKIIKIREWDVCVDGVAQQALFISSAPYDP